MTDTDKILHALAEMQKDIHSLKEGQATLQSDVKSLSVRPTTMGVISNVYLAVIRASGAEEARQHLGSSV